MQAPWMQAPWMQAPWMQAPWMQARWMQARWRWISWGFSVGNSGRTIAKAHPLRPATPNPRWGGMASRSG